MFAEERRTLMLELLAQDGRIEVKDMAQRFGVSLDSIRRDLAVMEEQGLLIKTHGGAVPHQQVRQGPQPPELRYGRPRSHEDAIAVRAAACLKANDTVYIGGAGIQYGVLQRIPDHLPLTIVTNSIKIAETAQQRKECDVILIGGKVRQSGTIADPISAEWIKQFAIDIGFFTGGGITERGISTGTSETALFIRSAFEACRSRIVLAPHQKVGRDAFMLAVPIERAHLLITDSEADPEVLDLIRARGVKIETVDASG
ncbi:DeoR/GlpR transcriptional regulator [Paenibacillus mesophilus]|uniref:DeoR/GlpR family DNA-binding transcription regulator n=1 Tax=Paenibacillus mesophilus TaxID=2582849 RepID=UPI00110DD856|nr:DeoR/GlpR family DNA-binding transcription regulator [Paenibacillus mesophilus]TMV47597.1 DeoR/GlpR transcriptional regulator [Paenibacillus mesophilus]